MENAVYLELVRRNYGNIYYWKEYGKSEGLSIPFMGFYLNFFVF